MTVDLVRLALSLQEQGNLGAAEQIFREALAKAPGDFEALHNLALLYAQKGNLDAAEATLRQAIASDPQSPDAKNHLGSILQARRRFDAAVALHREAIALDPDYGEAHYDLGVALQALGRTEEAASAYRGALALDADWPEAQFNLALTLQALGRLEEATQCYAKAVALKPDYDRAQGNLGGALLAQGRTDEALAALDRALALNPDFAEAHHNRASALATLHRFDEALAAFDRALALKSDDAEWHNSRAAVLVELGRFDEALAACDQALRLKRDHAPAHNNRAIALTALRRLGDAIAAYENALRVDPLYAHAAAQIFHLKQRVCDWQDAPAQATRLRALVDGGARIPPFTLMAAPVSAADQLRVARRCIEGFAIPAGPAAAPRSHAKLRLGYLSNDLHEHATAYLMAELVERHDRARFEVAAYSFGPDDGSATRRRLTQAFDRFVDIGRMSDEEAARRIATDEIDILVDLKGFTQGARTEIVLRRPAPIQVNFLGYPGTMGADAVDYIVADRWIIPEDRQGDYAEAVAVLPDCYQPNDRQRGVADHTPSRAEAGLPADGFVFCSFNDNYKIAPPVFDVWMRLLRDVAGSVIWLLQDNELAAANLRQEAERRGVAAERLVFAPRVPHEAHLARQRLADLFLDTLPCNAHTTASDAMWVGLPLVTCLGETFAGRVAGSVVAAVGLPELVTGSLAEYETLALTLARDGARLAGLKRKLSGARESCALFDTDRYRRNLEAALLAMWERHESGQSPASFVVPPAG